MRQTIALPDDPQYPGDSVDLGRENFDTQGNPEQLPSKSRIRIKASSGDNDSERIVRVCSAMDIVLEFVRTAKHKGSKVQTTDGTINLEAGAALQSAVEELELLREQLYAESPAPRNELNRVSMFEEIVGTSAALKGVLARVERVAATDSTVLVTGETGTGKELVAQAIHRRSNRASGPFVAVNCAAIPRELIASELFGHEKGAFTGATQQRLGRFELADRGTLFLDEVGDLPPETQVALLRVLQEHEFERVGGSRRIHTDVRLIAATNRDLQAATSEGSFRSDLFYRLHVFPIQIPSLRERREDILLLVEYFIDRFARKAGKNITSVDKKSLRRLVSYPWPGNVRELQNVVERSVILCESDTFSIDESWLALPCAGTEWKLSTGFPGRLDEEEKRIIEEALEASRGRVFGPTGAAAKLGIPRSTLESKIKALRIEKNRFKPDPEG